MASAVLDDLRDVTVSPDGRNAYVASSGGDAVVVFDRDAASGELTEKFRRAACVSHDGNGGRCVDGNPLDIPVSLTVSPDGRNVYAAALQSAAIAVFDRSTNGSEPPPLLSISDVTVDEGDTDTADAVFEVSLSAPSAQRVTVDVATADDTAVAPDDYVTTHARVSFEPGQTVDSATVRVPVAADVRDEADETFTVELSRPTEAMIGDGQGRGTIIDSDAPDTTPPVTTLALSPADPDGDGGWYRNAVRPVVESTDGVGVGVAETRCVLDPPSPPSGFDDLPPGCDGADVTADGTHVLYAAAIDGAGNAGALAVTSFKLDRTPPVVTCPDPAPSFRQHDAAAEVSAMVSDALSGPMQSSVSAAAETTSLGADRGVTLTGADNAGNVTATRCSYTVSNPPSAHAGGPYIAGEGGTLMLNGSRSSDPTPRGSTRSPATSGTSTTTASTTISSGGCRV